MFTLLSGWSSWDGSPVRREEGRKEANPQDQRAIANSDLVWDGINKWESGLPWWLKW